MRKSHIPRKIVKIYDYGDRFLVVVEGGSFFAEVPKSWDFNQIKQWLKN